MLLETIIERTDDFNADVADFGGSGEGVVSVLSAHGHRHASKAARFVDETRNNAPMVADLMTLAEEIAERARAVEALASTCP